MSIKNFKRSEVSQNFNIDNTNIVSQSSDKNIPRKEKVRESLMKEPYVTLLIKL